MKIMLLMCLLMQSLSTYSMNNYTIFNSTPQPAHVKLTVLDTMTRSFSINEYLLKPDNILKIPILLNTLTQLELKRCHLWILEPQHLCYVISEEKSTYVLKKLTDRDFQAALTLYSLNSKHKIP